MGPCAKVPEKKKKAVEAREWVARLVFSPEAPGCVWSFEGEPKPMVQHLLSYVAGFSWRWLKIWFISGALTGPCCRVSQAWWDVCDDATIRTPDAGHGGAKFI